MIAQPQGAIRNLLLRTVAQAKKIINEWQALSSTTTTTIQPPTYAIPPENMKTARKIIHYAKRQALVYNSWCQF
jgi:hypothetical protein